MSKKQLLSFFLCLLLLFSVTGCSQKPQSETLKIAVTIPPVATFVSAVTQNLAEIQVLVPVGYSPETYSPTPKELMSAQEAALYFSIGVPAEEEAILPHLNSSTQIISLDQAAEQDYPARYIGTERDPHVWLSPKRVQSMVTCIIDTLCEYDPVHAGIYEQNGASFLAELGALDLEIEETLSDLDNRTFLVFHPAFGYFADDYNLNMLALEEEGKEATPQHMQEMIDLAKAQDVHVIFYQEEIDSRQAEAFARELSGKTVALDPLSSDYCNNLRKMATTIKEAIQN